MFRKTAGLTVIVLAASWAFCGAGLAAGPDKAEMDKAFAALPKYDWGQSRGALNQIDGAIVASHGDAAARKDLETRLAAVLTADATRAAKQYACRKLAIIGSAASVDALARLLADKDLSHMGRYALERMDCPPAAKALRDAMGKVEGKLKIGMINSLGMRQDAEALPALTGLLKNSDAAIAAAAAAAMGRIGSADSAAPLADFLAKAPKPLQGAAIDATLDLAQRLAKQGKKDQAAKIYEKFHAPDQLPRVRRAALQGLVTVRPAKSMPLLLAALGSDDPALRGLGVRLVKETKGPEATKAFAGSLAKLPVDGQVALLDALQARKDPAARSAVLAAVKHKDAKVRAAALQALSTVGGPADVPLLAETAAAGKKDESNAARKALSSLGAKGVDEAIVAAVGKGEAKVRSELLRALASRSATQAAPVVAQCVKDEDDTVRRAAIDALGALGDEKQVPLLVELAKKPTNGGDRGNIERALVSIASRVREKAAGDLIGGLKGADADASVTLLNALVRAGGADALKAVVAATADSDAKVKDGAIRALSGWTAPDAMAPLLELAGSAEKQNHQVLALRGYIALVRKHKGNPKQQVERLGKAMGLAKRNDEKKRVLGGLGDVQTIDSLKLVAPHVGTPALAEDAGAVATRIAGRIWQKNKDFVRTVLLEVTKNVKSQRTKRDAQKILGQVGPKAP